MMYCKRRDGHSKHTSRCWKTVDYHYNIFNPFPCLGTKSCITIKLCHACWQIPYPVCTLSCLQCPSEGHSLTKMRWYNCLAEVGEVITCKHIQFKDHNSVLEPFTQIHTKLSKTEVYQFQFAQCAVHEYRGCKWVRVRCTTTTPSTSELLAVLLAEVTGTRPGFAIIYLGFHSHRHFA